MVIGRRAFILGSIQTAVLGGAPATAEALPSVPLPKGGASRIAHLNGIDLHYVVAGSGPAVILLHGWPQTWFAWRETMEAFSAHFTVIAPDLRGLGLSERPVGSYDKRIIAEDILALIHHEASGQAHVVGHDMGGKAAFVLARLHPEAIRTLTLVDCLVPGTENGDALHGGAWHYGFHAAPDFPEMLTVGREHAYLRGQIRAWSYRKDAVSEAAISEYARRYATPGGMAAGFAYYRALRDDATFVASLNSRLSLPVLAVAGRYGVGPRLAEALRDYTDDLRSVIIEESGHFVAEEAPSAFQQALMRFLTA